MKKVSRTAISLVSSAVLLSSVMYRATVEAKVNPDGHSQVHATSSKSLTVTDSFHYADSPYPSNKSLVKLKAFGTGVTANDVSHVASILNKVNSVGRVSSFLGLHMNHAATVYLVKSSSSYAKLLKQIGVSSGDANNLSQDSNGFTLRDTVIIPLNQNQTDTELANTLTHELTHATINQNISSIPSWMNEGMAVYMGFNGQKAIESPVQFEGDEREYADDILQIVQDKQLIPLTGDESAILSGAETYDYELQDWLAVCDLIHQYGILSISKLANALTHENADTAFAATFGESVATFNTKFTAQLEAAAKAKNSGAVVTVNVPSHFAGTIQFLGPNQTSYHALKAKPGTFQIKWNADGSITSNLPTATAAKSVGYGDPTSAYISFVPSSPMSENGKQVRDIGFRFDFENGLYAFQNSWIDFKGGQVSDQSGPSVLGITITNVTESGQSNPLLPILDAE